MRAGTPRWLTLLLSDRVALVACVYLIALAFVATFADPLSPYDPNEQDLFHRLQPVSWSGGSSLHMLGTDSLGRDVASRLIEGAHLALLIPLVGVVVALVVGTTLGLAAGFYGGIIDGIIMRTVDAMMAYSSLMIVIVMVLMLGGGVGTLMVVFGLVNWVLFARTVRGVTLVLRETPHVLAARSAGCSDSRLLFAHVLPSAIGVIISLAIIVSARLMAAEAGLSFLGYGVQPPGITWGLILAEARAQVAVAPWLVALPGLAITLTILALTLLGGWLRMATDPFGRDESRV